VLDRLKLIVDLISGNEAKGKADMAVKTVLRMGEPLLYRVADKITQFDTPELHALIADMHDTMTQMNGAGIAAPQIGVSLQVVMFGVGANPRYPDAEEVPFTILINPELTPVDQAEEEGWEGCLSVPGMRGLVPRYQHLHYRGFDPQGNLIDRTVSGFHARVVQHECDHLFGVLYPMRIRDLTKFGFNDVLFPGITLPDD
jgi:peptide deformylase